MLTNDDLKTLSDTAKILNNMGTPVAVSLSNKLVKIHNKGVDYKNRVSENSKEYNKKNRKYHNLQNALCYNRKMKNWARVRELEKELGDLKKKKLS